MGTVSGVVFLMFFEKFRNCRKECLPLQPQPLFRTEFGFLANLIFEAFPGIRKSKDPRILAYGKVRYLIFEALPGHALYGSQESHRILPGEVQKLGLGQNRIRFEE